MINSLSSPEQEKVTSLLNKFGVDYIATGDFAMRKYVDSKYFQNIQLWVKPTPDNFQKVSDAFASVRRKFDVDEKGFTTENADAALVKIGKGRKGVELYTGVPGMTTEDFNKVFADRKVLNAGSVPIPILSQNDLYKTLEKSNLLAQKADLQLLERAMPKLNPTISKKLEVPVIDWKEASRTIDPHRLLESMGFSHIPNKGFFGTSKSQTYERGDERVSVYPNRDNPMGKPFFMDQITGKKGDGIDLLNWQHNYNSKEVNRALKEHFGGLAPMPLSTVGSTTKKNADQDTKPDAKAVAEFQQKELKEKYGVKNSLERPEYLLSRDLSLNTIFRPEFFKQVLNSLGWSTKQEKTINVDNTVFPMRNDQGLTSMIIRNTGFKGFPTVERHDSVWLSNPPLSLNKDIKIGHGEKQVILPKGTEGTLVPYSEKPGSFHFYYVDPHKAGKELNFNKLEVPANKVEQLTKALNPLRVDRLVVTESPIDAMSLHQLSPPKAGETRMYLATGGQPSEKQLAYINQLIQRIQPTQIIPANDNEKVGTKFNINLMGAIQPSGSEGKQFMARINETKEQKDASGNTIPSEYHLKISGVKDPKQVAQKITDAINRFTPKGVEPPARITLLNGSTGTGSEVTIAFPANDRFLQIVEKQLTKLVNEHSTSKDLVKVVKPLNKDFNEDLAQSQQQKTKVNYDLDMLPRYIKHNANNLYNQLTGYTNSAFDALFGGVPGSLPRSAEAPTIKKENVARIIESEKIQLPKDKALSVDLPQAAERPKTSEGRKIDLDFSLSQAKALSYASYQFLDRNRDNRALSSGHKEVVQNFKTNIDNAIKNIEVTSPGLKSLTVTLDFKDAKIVDKSMKEMVTFSLKERSIHVAPDKWEGMLENAQSKLSNAINGGKKEVASPSVETTTKLNGEKHQVNNGVKKTMPLAAEEATPELLVKKGAKVRM